MISLSLFLSLLKLTASAFVILFIHSKIKGAGEKAGKAEIAQAIVENHAAAQKVEAAQTKEEADAALDALAQSDRK